jgi:hypothetical protein
MKNYTKLLFFVLLAPLSVIAQSNYRPGYVVTLKGDTIKGFIDYREWNSNPGAIDFKTDLAGKDKKYTPQDLSFFSITGQESYLQYTGPLTMDSTDPAHISTIRDTSFQIQTVFLKIWQKGKNIALYSYADGVKRRYFVSEAPDYKPLELGYRLYYNYGSQMMSGQEGSTVTENGYMKELFALANKYEVLDSDLQWRIEHAGYNEDDLLKIVSKINHFTKADLKKNSASRGPQFNLFIGAGVNFNTFSPTSSSAYYTGGGRSYTSAGPAASVGVNFFANPATRQLQFRLEAGISKSQYRDSYTLEVYPYGPFKASFDQLAFSLTPQIIYNFYNAENFKVYAGAGVSILFLNYSNPYLGSQAQPNTSADIEAANPYFFIKSGDVFVLKAGVEIQKHWGIFGQYSSSLDVTNGGYFQMSSTCMQIGLNYSFR